MKIRFTKRNLMMMELVGVLLLHIAELAIRFPFNHANKLMFNYRDCIFALLFFEIIHSLLKKELCITFWIIFCLSFAIPFVEDKFNILVTYEIWTSRGMPDWGHYDIAKFYGQDVDEDKKEVIDEKLQTRDNE